MSWKQMSFDDFEKEEPKPIYAVLDFETGSFDEKTGGLCSVGIILLDQNLNEYDRNYFVLYEPGRAYESGALRVNGLSVEQLERDGLRSETFIPLLHQIVDGKIMVNHNSAFDLRWLNRMGWSYQESVDTMVNDINLNPALKHKLGMVYQRYFGHEFQGAHNALSDVEATCDLLRWQAKKDTKYLMPQQIKWDRFSR